MNRPETVAEYFVELDHPEQYVEQLLLESPDAVHRAAPHYLQGPQMLPRSYQPHAESLAHLAAVQSGHTSDYNKVRTAALRGFGFGYLVMANTAVEGQVDLAYGPLVSRQKPREWQQRIAADSDRLTMNSAVINRAVEHDALVIDQQEIWPRIARLGMLMSLQMAGYGEMRKHQDRIGESALVTAGYVLGRGQLKYGRERYRQETANRKAFEAILALPVVPEPDRPTES